MTALHTTSIARYADAAKRLLRELEQQSETASRALGHEANEAFVAAVDERDRILAQLGEVVDALSQQRLARDPAGNPDPSMAKLLTEMAQAAAAALESHDRLAAQTRRERDRLAEALNRASRVDAVAQQYGAASPVGRSATLSVTG